MLKAGLIPVDSELDDVTFDAVQSESISHPSTVSSHPTVDGETVVDNVEDSPTTYSVTARMTAQGPTGVRIDDGPIPLEGNERLVEAEKYLQRLMGIKVQYISPRFGITGVGVASNLEYSLVKESRVDFSFEFTEFKFARRRTVDLPPERTPKPTNKNEKDAGEQKTDDTEVDTDLDPRSFAFQGFDTSGYL